MNIFKGILIIGFGTIAVACGTSAEEIALMEQEKARVKAEAEAELEESTNDAFAALEEEPALVHPFPFTSEDGHFSINFPGATTHSAETMDTEIGPTTLDVTTYESEDGMEAYMVCFNDYHDASILMADPQVLMNGGRDGALSQLEIPYTDEQHRLTYGEYEGLYFTANNGNFYVDYEIYLVGQRMYQIAILKAGEYPSDADRDAFFESFKLNNVEEIAE